MKRIIINTNQLKETVELQLSNPSPDFNTNLEKATTDPNAEKEVVVTPDKNNGSVAITPEDKKTVNNAIKDPKTIEVNVWNPDSELYTSIPTNNKTTNESKYTKTMVEKMRIYEMRKSGWVMTKKELEENFK